MDTGTQHIQLSRVVIMPRRCAIAWMLFLTMLGNVPVSCADAERGADATASQSQTVQSEWPAKLQPLYKGDVKAAYAIIGDLIALPPDEGLALVTEAWPKISPDVRPLILKSWFESDSNTGRQHQRVVNVLDLGMRDPAPKVKESARYFLLQLALIDFNEAPHAYAAWYRQNKDKVAGTVTAESVARFAQQAARADEKERVRLANSLRMANTFRTFPVARQVAVSSGLSKTLRQWVVQGVQPDRSKSELGVAINALKVLRYMPFEEAELRNFVVPLLQSPTPSPIKEWALSMLEGKTYPWIADLALQALMLPPEKRLPSTLTWTAASVLASINDPKTIPKMIEAIEADDTNATIYGIGYYGLAKMTGVKYDEKHNGAWWRVWWNENQQRYATTSGSTPVKFAKREEQVAQQETADTPADDDAEVQDNRVDGNEKKRYFLIGDIDLPTPSAGRPLLVVLPGGDGGPDFSNWVKTIDREALSEEWLVAQMVAPRWDEQQFSRLVWPTAGSRYPGAEFTTEELVESVLGDVRKKAKIDPARIYVLGWSSGGPPSYALLLQKDSPFRGGLIAMSIFKTSREEAKRRLAGKRFYLLQSPEDKVTRFFFAEEAVKQLEAAGGSVKLQTYEGGHGWQDNPLDQIRQGIKWLEQTESDS
jgi:predicted esterase